MYSTDFRSRMSNYDRMRADQDRVTSLLSKSRDVKKKLKNGDYSHLKKTQRTVSDSPAKQSSDSTTFSSRNIQSYNQELDISNQRVSIDPAIFA